MRTPDFFLLGPLKAGSSSVFQSLIKHPAISPPPRKEMRYFCTGSEYPEGYWDYKTEYKKGAPGLTFDATPHYFADPMARYRIHQTLGPVKVICCLRDPIERFMSNVRVDRAVNYIQADETLRGEYVEARPFVNNQWLGEERSADQIIEDHRQRQYDPLDHFSQGEYIRHLKQWQELMTAPNVHVCIFEDFIQQPSLELAKIQQFLNLPIEPLILPQADPGADWDDRSKRDLTAEFSDEHFEYLAMHYRPYTQALEQYLDRSLPWKGTPD